MNFQKKILLIDDDQRLGKTLKNVLAVEGYDVCFANGGAVGIHKAFEYSPDLILCDIRMEPIDGYHVFDVLKESSMIDYTPFIFLTGNSEVEDIRYGMNLGADDYIIKPFNNDDLIRSIENRLSKYKKLKEAGKDEMKVLFKITPTGILIFNNHHIISANPSILKTLELDKNEIFNLRIEDILDSNSRYVFIENIQRCMNGITDCINDSIVFVSKSGRHINATIYACVYNKSAGSKEMIALIHLSNRDSKETDYNHIALEVFKALKTENITITHSLGEKLMAIFKTQKATVNNQFNLFFTKREMEILCYSMEGLPMKMIADKLSISDRTVEKHRAKMMEKTGANNIIEVIVYALRNNLVEV